ncbi:hypothetical protein AHAS_Ahas16G0184500 [Arachis hypogaea]
MEEYPYPSIQEKYDPTYTSQVEQEPMDHLKEAMDRLQAIIRQKEQEEAQKRHKTIEDNLAKIKAALDSRDSRNKQSISMDDCEKSTKERSIKEILESQHENKEMGYVLQQVESEEIVNEEEVVEELGKVEQEVDSKFGNISTSSGVVNNFVEVVEPSSNVLEFDVKEGAQPPKHIMNDEELKEGEQATNLPLKDDPTPTHDPLVFEEPSPIDIENFVKKRMIKRQAPPMKNVYKKLVDKELKLKKLARRWRQSRKSTRE